MAAQVCHYQLEKLKLLVHHHGLFMLTFSVLHFICSIVATFGNVLVIRALWKASSISATIKKMFLSLAFSDLAVGLFAQLMFGVIIAVMLKMAANGHSCNFEDLCPTITVCTLCVSALFCASFLNVSAIAVDRLLAICLHLRYQELATPKRVNIVLVSLWFASGVAASLYISFPSSSGTVIVIPGFVGILITTVAYARIYKVVKYHQNQINSHLQLAKPQEAVQLLRERKCAFNALFVYVVFLVCYLPHVCTVAIFISNGSQTSLLVAEVVAVFLVFLNSSINPLVYCWRYREIRKIVKTTVKKIFCNNDTGT